jgi:uncharacterized SAM-binding protein YcdF (DUF218 family)
LGSLGVLLFLAVAFTPLSNVLNRGLRVDARLEPADAIVVLASDVAPDGTLSNQSLRRALHGVALYRRGLAPLLLFSGIRPSGGPSEALARADLARSLGIPPEAVLTAEEIRTTRDEALSVAARLRPRGARRILLVSDSQHLVRAARLFERAGFEVLAAPADSISPASATPGARLGLMLAVVQELLSRLYYRVAGYT